MPTYSHRLTDARSSHPSEALGSATTSGQLAVRCDAAPRRGDPTNSATGGKFRDAFATERPASVDATPPKVRHRREGVTPDLHPQQALRSDTGAQFARATPTSAAWAGVDALGGAVYAGPPCQLQVFVEASITPAWPP
jgi:hypothetical protein